MDTLIETKACERCSGYLTHDRDEYGAFTSCLHCGYVTYPKVKALPRFKPRLGGQFKLRYVGDEPIWADTVVDAQDYPHDGATKTRVYCPYCGWSMKQTSGFKDRGTGRYGIFMCNQSHIVWLMLDKDGDRIGWR